MQWSGALRRRRHLRRLHQIRKAAGGFGCWKGRIGGGRVDAVSERPGLWLRKPVRCCRGTEIGPAREDCTERHSPGTRATRAHEHTEVQGTDARARVLRDMPLGLPKRAGVSRPSKGRLQLQVFHLAGGRAGGGSHLLPAAIGVGASGDDEAVGQGSAEQPRSAARDGRTARCGQHGTSRAALKRLLHFPVPVGWLEDWRT